MAVIGLGKIAASHLEALERIEGASRSWPASIPTRLAT